MLSQIAIPTQCLEFSGPCVFLEPSVKRQATAFVQSSAMFRASTIDMIDSQEMPVCFPTTNALSAVGCDRCLSCVDALGSVVFGLSYTTLTAPCKRLIFFMVAAACTLPRRIKSLSTRHVIRPRAFAACIAQLLTVGRTRTLSALTNSGQVTITLCQTAGRVVQTGVAQRSAAAWFSASNTLSCLAATLAVLFVVLCSLSHNPILANQSHHVK